MIVAHPRSNRERVRAGATALVLLVATAVCVPDASGDSTRPRENGLPSARAKLHSILVGRTADGSVIQRARETTYRAKLTHLRAADEVPLPPLAGDWIDGDQIVTVRDPGDGRLRLSWPGTDQPESTYDATRTSESVHLTGQVPRVERGRVRTFREEIQLVMTHDGNHLEGTVERFDDFSVAGRPARGKLDSGPVQWRRRFDLSPRTVLAWQAALAGAPERQAAEAARREAEETRRGAVEAKRLEAEAKKAAPEPKAADMEADLLGEETPAAPAAPAAGPPLPSIPKPVPPGVTPTSAVAPAPPIPPAPPAAPPAASPSAAPQPPEPLPPPGYGPPPDAGAGPGSGPPPP